MTIVAYAFDTVWRDSNGEVGYLRAGDNIPVNWRYEGKTLKVQLALDILDGKIAPTPEEELLTNYILERMLRVERKQDA